MVLEEQDQTLKVILVIEEKLSKLQSLIISLIVAIAILYVYPCIVRNSVQVALKYIINHRTEIELTEQRT